MASPSLTRLLISFSAAIYWGVSSSTLVLAASIDSSPAQEPQSRLVELRFGATTIAFERGEIAWVSGHGKPHGSTDATLSIARNASVFFRPSFDIPACLEIGQVILTYQTVDPILRQPLFVSYTRSPTEFRDISRLVPPSGRPVLDLYQFEAGDMKDFWGEQITFYRQPPMIRVNIQLTRDVEMHVAATVERCFFEHGEAIIRQLISFVNGKVK